MRNYIAVVSALVMLAAVGQAQGGILTFDDLGSESAIPIPDGYGGFDWTDFSHMDGTVLAPGSGFDNGRVSNYHVAYNADGNAAAVCDGAFDFNSAYLTGAWRDGLNVQVTGFLGKDLLGNPILKYDTTVTVDTTAPKLFNFNYLNIDRLVFSSFGGTPAGLADNHFAMDNFTFTTGEQVIPEPASLVVWSLLAALSISFAYWRRRRVA